MNAGDFFGYELPQPLRLVIHVSMSNLDRIHAFQAPKRPQLYHFTQQNTPKWKSWQRF